MLPLIFSFLSFKRRSILFLSTSLDSSNILYNISLIILILHSLSITPCLSAFLLLPHIPFSINYFEFLFRLSTSPIFFLKFYVFLISFLLLTYHILSSFMYLLFNFSFPSSSYFPVNFSLIFLFYCQLS